MAAIQPTPETHDVVVIGSGAGGGTVAHVPTALGLRVTLLERVSRPTSHLRGAFVQRPDQPPIPGTRGVELHPQSG